MTSKQLNRKPKYQISDKCIILDFWQTIGHYSIVLIPLILSAIEIFYKLIDKTIFNPFSTSTKLLFLLASLIIGYFKWKELNYYEIEEFRSDKEFKESILATANKLNWNITELSSKKVKARGYNPWKSRDAQSITIERSNDRIRINSMNEIGLMSGPDFTMANKRNRNTFLHYYHHSNKIENLNRKVIQHLKAEEAKLENESEWSLVNTLKRIIAYLFCFAFIGIGLAIGQSDRISFIVLFLCLIGLSYIVFGLYVMWTKRNRASS